MIPPYFTRIEGSDPSGQILCTLDTLEGSNCFGHWVNECAIFLPDIVEIRKEYPSLKLLLRNKKKYKDIFLREFGFEESDIVYVDNIVYNCKCQVWHDGRTEGTTHGWYAGDHGFCMPIEPYKLLIQPHFLFLNKTTVHTTLFQTLLIKFKSALKIPLSDQEVVPKTIPFLYLIRSRKENYGPNARVFENIEDVAENLSEFGVKIICVDDLKTIREQIDLVLSAKVIILEYGSAMINATFFSNNSHIIILNHFPLGKMHVNLMHDMMTKNGTTWEFVPPQIQQYTPFSIHPPAIISKLLPYLKCAL